MIITVKNIGKMLKDSVSLRFPQTPGCANILARTGDLPLGKGHNATTILFPTVVPSVVAFCEAFSTTYPLPTTAQRKIAPLICVCVCARAHACHTPFLRCAVVLFSYLFENKEKYREIRHNDSHNARKIWPKIVVPTVVGFLSILPKPLKYNKKGGFYA